MIKIKSQIWYTNQQILLYEGTKLNSYGASLQ